MIIAALSSAPSPMALLVWRALIRLFSLPLSVNWTRSNLINLTTVVLCMFNYLTKLSPAGTVLRHLTRSLSSLLLPFTASDRHFAAAMNLN